MTADIDNGEGLLKPEMTGMAKVYGNAHRIADLALRRLARYVRVEFWTWW